MKWEFIGNVIQKVVVPLVTVATATMVAWLNASISKVDSELKAQIALVDIAVKEAQAEREKLRAEREFNFKIYDLVQQSLEEGNQQKQEVAKQFVLVMVDGELRQRLLGVLQEGGTPKIKRDTSRVLAQEREFAIEQNTVLKTVRVQAPSFNWEDWDYDIFWCSSSGRIANTQASLIKQQMEKEGAKGRIRVRELYDSVNARSGYQISGYVIRRSENEVRQAGALKKLSEKTLVDNGYRAVFEQQMTSQTTQWYLSAFICP
mgnify:CR=1 FL=1